MVQMQHAGNGSVDIMVSVWESVHSEHSGTGGDFFYFQIDKNGKPKTKAFIFDGSYGGYDFFSELMGISRNASNSDKLNLYVLNQITGGRSIRSYPTFCNSIFGYSKFELDLNTAKTSSIEYFCPGIIDTLPPSAATGKSSTAPKYSFANTADGTAILTHYNTSRSYPEVKFITFKNDTVTGVTVSDSSDNITTSFSLSAAGYNGKSSYLMTKNKVGSNSIDFAHFGVVQDGTVTHQKIARISEKAFSGNINIDMNSNGDEYLTVLSRPALEDNMPDGTSLYKLALGTTRMDICNTSDSVVAHSRNIPFSSVTLPALKVIPETIITNATQLIADEVKVLFIKKCEVISKCDSIQIIAPDSICTGASFNVTIRKNESCGKIIGIDSSPEMQLLQRTNDSTYLFKINQTGNHEISATFRNCNEIKSIKTIVATVDNMESIKLPFHDTTLCTGASLTIDAPPGYKSYSWDNGATYSQSIHINTNGLYYIDAETYCGNYSRDSIKITYDSSLSRIAKIKSEICFGDTALLQIIGDSQPNSFTWLPTQNSQFNLQDNILKIWPSLTTQYKFEALSEYKCTITDSTIITVFSLPSGDAMGKKVYDLCKNDSITVRPNGAFHRYLWSTGDTTHKISIRNPGDYSLIVFDDHNCNNKYYFKVQEIFCFNKIYFPSAFSPNKDGLNDLFKAISFNTEPKIFELKIYNRFGQLIFIGNDIKKGWNGSFKDLQQPAGTYVWLCRYQLEGREMKIEKGTLLLTR